MTDTDLAELARLQGLRDAATPGPWVVEHRHHKPFTPRTALAKKLWALRQAAIKAGEPMYPSEDDAAFIASAHDAVDLAERLARRMLEARAEVIEQCAQVCDAEARQEEIDNGAASTGGAAACAAAIRALKEKPDD